MPHPTDPPPDPPVIREPAVRLVFSDVGLADLFVHAAASAGLAAELVDVTDLAGRATTLLAGWGATRVSLTDAGLLRKVGLPAALNAAGHGVVGPGETADAAVTTVPVAVAETGTLGLAESAAGWLACPNRIAVVEPRNLVADLIDWAERAAAAPTLVSGPVAAAVLVLQ